MTTNRMTSTLTFFSMHLTLAKGNHNDLVGVGGLILENKAYIWYNKKGQESSVKGHNCGFTSLIFPNLGYLER